MLKSITMKAEFQTKEVKKTGINTSTQELKKAKFVANKFNIICKMLFLLEIKVFKPEPYILPWDIRHGCCIFIDLSSNSIVKKKHKTEECK